jgi:hypothetical protein
MGGNQGGQPLHSEPIDATHPEPGSQPGADWGESQKAREEQSREHQDETKLKPIPDGGPLQEDAIGTTHRPATAPTPRP